MSSAQEQGQRFTLVKMRGGGAPELLPREGLALRATPAAGSSESPPGAGPPPAWPAEGSAPPLEQGEAPLGFARDRGVQQGCAGLALWWGVRRQAGRPPPPQVLEVHPCICLASWCTKPMSGLWSGSG